MPLLFLMGDLRMRRSQIETSIACQWPEDALEMYVNPGNEGFADTVSDEYVDETGLTAPVNTVTGMSGK